MALPAAAKEDVEATLTSPVALDAPAGTELTIAWTLISVDANGRRQPFGANGVFVRLLSASGAPPEEGVAPVGSYETGEYEATVIVPAGGIRDIELGLQGWVSDVNGTRRSDLIFPITNDPISSPAPVSFPAPVEPAPSNSDGTPGWLLALVAGLLAMLALAGTILIRRRRGHDARSSASRDPSRQTSVSVSPEA
jgi:hypothetical protein